jgi:hypothetical protein
VIGSQTICRGQASGLMTLADHRGEVLRWEFSKDDRKTWVSMGKGGLEALNSGRLTVNTWFRAIIGRSGCAERPSEAVLIAVEDQQHGGVLTGGGNFCGQAVNPLLELVGSRGSIQFWERSADGLNWFRIDHALPSLLLGTLERSERFRVVLGSARCGLIRSTEAVFNISPSARGGRVESNHTVCRGQASQPMRLVGYQGNIKGWEFSKDQGQKWFFMGKAGLESLTSGRLTVSTRFRALVETAFCAPVASEPVQVSVESDVSNGEVLGGGQFCAGNPYPELRWTLSNVPVLRWEVSNDRGNSWQPIHHTLPTYRPSGTVQGVHLFRVIRGDGICANGQSASASVAAIQPPSAGTLTTTNSTICAGNPAHPIQLVGANGAVLRWERRNPSDPTWHSINFKGLILEPGLLPATTEFRVVVDGGSCGAIYSPSLLVQVVQLPVPVQPRVSAARLCAESNSVAIELTGIQADVLAWEVRDAGTGLVDRISVPTKRLEINGLSSSSFIRAELDTRGCGQLFTPETFVEVNQPIDLQLSGTGVCGGRNRLVATASGGTGSFTYHLIPGSQPVNSSGVFDGLPAGTYTVSTRDAVGCSAQRTINLNALVDPPRQVRVEQITATSVLVSWKPIPGVGVRYEVRYKLVGESTWYVAGTVAQPLIQVNGLQSGGFYEVEVAALCPRADGNGSDRIPSGERPRFATLATGTCAQQPPTVPGGVYVSQVASRSARVHWSPHQNMSAQQGYIVSFGLEHLNPNNWPQFVICHPDTFFTIGGLTPNTRYGVRVRANCTNCTTALQSTDRRSAWSKIIAFETLSLRATTIETPFSQVRLYPNPTRNGFDIEFPCAADVFELDILDLNGRSVWSGRGTSISGGWRYEPGLAAGVYRVRLRYCTGEANLPLVVY